MIGALAVARPRSRAPLAAVGLAGAATAALAVALGLPPVGLMVTSAIFVLVGILVVIAAAAHHPHARFGLANQVTLARAGGAAIFAGLVAAPELVVGWTAAAAAAGLLALDGIDGWAARRQGLESGFGARFDMETDALIILALAALALALGKAGPWVLALGAMRYAFVAAGLVWPRLARPLPPSLRRKAVCVLQVVALTVLLAPVVAPPVSASIGAVALAVLGWSFAMDLRWLIRTRP